MNEYTYPISDKSSVSHCRWASERARAANGSVSVPVPEQESSLQPLIEWVPPPFPVQTITAIPRRNQSINESIKLMPSYIASFACRNLQQGQPRSGYWRIYKEEQPQLCNKMMPIRWLAGTRTHMPTETVVQVGKHTCKAQLPAECVMARPQTEVDLLDEIMSADKQRLDSIPAHKCLG
jgi:hypothetical protein